MIDKMKNFAIMSGSLKNALFSLIAVFFLILTGCDSNDDPISTDISSAISTDEEVVDGYFEDTDDVVFEANDKVAATNGRSAMDDSESLTRCAEITHDTENKTIIIDFGDGCEGPGGKIRSGKIIITYTDRKYVPGAVWVYTLENYTVNGIALEGTKTLTNVSGSENDYLSFNKVLEGGKATWPDGSFATREVNKTFTWIRERFPVNDEFHVEGEASGVTKDGVSYQVDILSKLIYKRKCRRAGVHIAVQGLKSVVKGDEEVLIDFGDGECDNFVTITKNGESEVADLTDKRRDRKS